MDRLTTFHDIETAVAEESNPRLHSTEIPGGRVGKLRSESSPRAGPPAVTIGPVAARGDRMQGLDDYMALGLHIARQGVKQILHRLFSNQGKIADNRVEPVCPEPTGDHILVGTDPKLSPTESPRFRYQRGHNVNTEDLDFTARKSTRQPAFPTANVKHAPWRQTGNGLDYGLVSDQRPTFDLLVLDGFRPGAGVRMPRSNDLSVTEFRHTSARWQQGRGRSSPAR